MSQEKIKIEKIDHVGVLTIDNPPANAFSAEVKDGLKSAIMQMREDEQIWTIVVTGQGKKMFMAGADIPKMLDMDRHGGLDRVRQSRELLSVVTECEKPIIAAINGYCLGGGLEVALCCDIRIAADHSRLGLPEVSLGLIPGAGGTQRLPRLIVPGWANYLLITGESISAQKALEIGLVQEIVPYDGLRDRAMELASIINRKGPLAVRSAKRAAQQGVQLSLEAALDLENNIFSEICETQDKREGISAFLEKRKPVFKGF